MPETFGSGTAGSSFDGRALPVTIASGLVLALGSASVQLGAGNPLLVLTALDVVTYGAANGQPLYFWSGTAQHAFVVFNIGSSADAFSWRGFLPLTAGQFGWSNASDADGAYFASGLSYLPSD